MKDRDPVVVEDVYAIVFGPRSTIERGDDVAGLNWLAARGLPDGLADGRGEAGSVFERMSDAFPRGSPEESWVTGANETFGTRWVSNVDLSFVLIAIAGVKVGDLSLISMISAEGCEEVSSGRGESRKSIESFLCEFPNAFPAWGVVNSSQHVSRGERTIMQLLTANERGNVQSIVCAAHPDAFPTKIIF